MAWEERPPQHRELAEETTEEKVSLFDTQKYDKSVVFDLERLFCVIGLDC